MHRTGLLLCTVVLLAVSACTSTGEDSFAISVRSSADLCEVAPVAAPAGSLAFTVTNEGSEVTEFYLYAGDGVQVIGEVENIGPGLTRTLTVRADPGSYVTACKPGMVGDGLRSAFTVND